jgi:hypothetical protein
MNLSFPKAWSNAILRDSICKGDLHHERDQDIGCCPCQEYFQLHGVDTAGKPVLRKAVSRRKLMEALVNLPPCLIGMEA